MELARPDDRGALLGEAHRARQEHRFADAREAFARAGRPEDLATEDVLAWADAAWWLGRADEALTLAELGHRRLLDDGLPVRAAMEAISLGFLLMLRGELSAGSGWLHRGRSLVERSSDDHAAGYLLHLDAEEAIEIGDLDRAIELARRAADAGRVASDAALTSLSLMAEGTARLRSGEVARAMALLDEAMLPVQAGQVPPEFAGNLYCQMIAVCWELADLRRAREWTAATEKWCENFDHAVMFSGICRMHRVQLQQVAGEWDAAEAEAEVVCRELVGMNAAVVAEGHYLLGDLHRLRGLLDQAEFSYLRAHELGRDPQPGLALVRAALGDVPAALTSLQTALAARDLTDHRQSTLLRALVDVAVAADDIPAAEQAADALDGLADRFGTDGLRAAATHARGTVELAVGEATSAIRLLRDAIGLWQQLGAPHDTAKARLLLAEACDSVGDGASGRLEREAAEVALQRLGAARDRRRPEPISSGQQMPGGLTPREAEVLALVAEGGTNREVAEQLVVSEKTVARHLANIHVKLGVSTRTAAAAWARRHGLV